MFLALQRELEKQGIALRLVEARSRVRDMLRLEGVEEKVEGIDRFTTLADAIDSFNKPPGVASAMHGGSRKEPVN